MELRRKAFMIQKLYCKKEVAIHVFLHRDFLSQTIKLLYRIEYVLSYLPPENNHRHFLIADFNRDSLGFFYVEFVRFV